MTCTTFSLVILLVTSSMASLLCPDDEKFNLASDGYQFPSIKKHLLPSSLFQEWWWFNLFSPKNEIGLSFQIYIRDPFHPEKSSCGISGKIFQKTRVLSISHSSPGESFYGTPNNATVRTPNANIELLSSNPFGRYRVTATAGDFDLVFTGLAPGALNGPDLTPLLDLRWYSHMPVASVSGSITVAGVPVTLTNVPAFHDHQYGDWDLSRIPSGTWSGVEIDYGWAQHSDVAQRLGLVWGYYKLPLVKDYVGFMFFRIGDTVRKTFGTSCLQKYNLTVLGTSTFRNKTYLSSYIVEAGDASSPNEANEEEWFVRVQVHQNSDFPIPDYGERTFGIMIDTFAEIYQGGKLFMSSVTHGVAATPVLDQLH